MKKSIVLLLCFAALLTNAAPAAAKKETAKNNTAGKKAPIPQLSILCTPESHIAKEGELVKFAITSTSPRPLEVTISLDGSDAKVFKKVTVKSPAVVTASLPTPGFLHCLVRTKGAKCSRGVAVAPEKIRYARKAPADFKQFWASALAESKALPLDLKFQAIRPDSDYFSFMVSCANVNGKRAYALYAYPKNAKGKLPLQVMFGGGEAYWNKSCVPSGA